VISRAVALCSLMPTYRRNMLPRSSGQVAREVVTQTRRRGWENGALSWLIDTVGRKMAPFQGQSVVLNCRKEMELREQKILFRAAIFIFVHRREHGIATTCRFACIITQPMSLPSPNLENWGRIGRMKEWGYGWRSVSRSVLVSSPICQNILPKHCYIPTQPLVVTTQKTAVWA
jgi:hypothetical protein